MTIKDLNASQFFKQYTEPPLPLKILYTHIRNLTIPLFTVYAHLPRHCENFFTQKRRIGFGALGIIYYSMVQGKPRGNPAGRQGLPVQYGTNKV